MERQTVDGEITLVPYYPNYKASLPWYQDPDVCKQVDDRNSACMTSICSKRCTAT